MDAFECRVDLRHALGVGKGSLSVAMSLRVGEEPKDSTAPFASVLPAFTVVEGFSAIPMPLFRGDVGQQIVLVAFDLGGERERMGCVGADVDSEALTISSSVIVSSFIASYETTVLYSIGRPFPEHPLTALKETMPFAGKVYAQTSLDLLHAPIPTQLNEELDPGVKLKKAYLE